MKYKGELSGFPEEVVEKMLDYQEAQGNKRDVSVFENEKYIGSKSGGFYWGDTTDGADFWSKVISHKDFDLFFSKYPKKKVSEYPKVMWVSCNGREWVKRVVFAHKAKWYISWSNVETIEESAGVSGVAHWQYAKDIEEEPVLELSVDQIAEKFGTTSDKIRIKKD